MSCAATILIIAEVIKYLTFAVKEVSMWEFRTYGDWRYNGRVLQWSGMLPKFIFSFTLCSKLQMVGSLSLFGVTSSCCAYGEKSK